MNASDTPVNQICLEWFPVSDLGRYYWSDSVGCVQLHLHSSAALLPLALCMFLPSLSYWIIQWCLAFLLYFSLSMNEMLHFPAWLAWSIARNLWSTGSGFSALIFCEPRNSNLLQTFDWPGGVHTSCVSLLSYHYSFTGHRYSSVV